MEVSASPQEGRTVVFPDPADLAAAVDDQPIRSKEEEVCSNYRKATAASHLACSYVLYHTGSDKVSFGM